MEILAFQIFIVFSLIMAKLISQKVLALGAASWAIFTLVMVFAAPLILLQLIVIWLTYSTLNTKGGRTFARNGKGRAQGQIRLSYPPTEAIDNYTDQIVLDAKIRGCIGELEDVIEAEKIVLYDAAKNAERVFEREKHLAEKGQDYRRAYRKHQARFESLFETAADKLKQEVTELPKLPDFEGRLKHHDPKAAKIIGEKYSALMGERHERVSSLLARMAEDQILEDAFWEKIDDASKKRLLESLDQ